MSSLEEIVYLSDEEWPLPDGVQNPLDEESFDTVGEEGGPSQSVPLTCNKSVCNSPGQVT